MNRTACVTTRSLVACASDERRTTTPVAATRIRCGFTFSPLIIRSSRAAASQPACSLSSATLDNGGSASSQRRSSLSTPTTATSSGTARSAVWQASHTCRPRSSSLASTPSGLASDRSHAARILCSRPHCRSEGRRGIGNGSQAWPAAASRDAKPAPRSIDQGKSPQLPTKAKCLKPRSSRCSAARVPAARESGRTSLSLASGLPGASWRLVRSRAIVGRPVASTARSTSRVSIRAMMPVPPHSSIRGSSCRRSEGLM